MREIGQSVQGADGTLTYIVSIIARIQPNREHDDRLIINHTNQMQLIIKQPNQMQ